MPLKRHEDKYEWEDLPCELGAHGQTDCKGTMDLKDVNLMMRRGRERLGPGSPKPLNLYLEKVYLCDTCGHIYMGYDDATIAKPLL